MIEYETGAVPFWDRELDFRHASFEPGMRVPSFGALLLPLLTEERLSEPAQVKELYRVIALATNRGVAVLTATDLREWALAGSAHSDAEPWALDVEALVVRADLAFLLERYCVARLIGATNPAALYLTPIEARLARALERIGLDARPQVQIGPYTVDFLVQDRVVVECDGAGYHDYRSDRSRDRALEERGYRVLRVSGGEIFRDADSCGSAVLALLNEPYFRSVPPAHDLSASQGPAAVHGEGPAWVAAPAGSGKTRVIEARVNHLLATGIEPKRICAISFTNRAVEEMRSRLPEADAAGVRFTTLHALAKEISELPPHGMRRKLVEGVKSPRGKTRWDILRPILKPEEYRFRRARDLWGDAIRAFRTSYAVPDFADFPEESRPDDVRFLEIHHEYARMLEEGGLTDFEGMVLNAVRSLARDAEFRALVGGRYDYWIVDEFQDLPPGKLALLRLLSSPARNLFVVGDDDQVIYGFAGASPSAFAEFDTAFPDRVERVLAENYRCPHEIVIRSLWLVERNANRISKRVTPMKPLERTEVVTVGRTDDYAELGLEFVTERLAEGYAPHEIALLFRLRDMAVPVERALAGAGVPFSRCSRLSFFTRKTVRSVRAWLRVAAGIGEPLDYVEALEWPTRYLRKATLAGVSSSSEFSQALKSDHDEGLRWLEDWAASLPDSTNRHAVAEFITLVRKTKSKPAPGRILDGLDLRKAAEGEAAPAGEAPPEIVVDIFRRLAEQFRSVEELETWIETRGHDKDYAIGEDEDVASVRARVGRVTLASVHQVKRALDAGRLVHR